MLQKLFFNLQIKVLRITMLKKKDMQLNKSKKYHSSEKKWLAEQEN